MVIYSELVAGLRRLGLKAGMKVMVHSSLSRFGSVEGGADSVVDALMEVVGESGTILMPSFNHEECYARGEVFDIRTTHTINGIIPDTFRKHEGVLRSMNPTHSYAAWGRDAAMYIAPGENTMTPLMRLMQDGGYCLLIGIYYKNNTFHHCVEMYEHAPCLGVESEVFDVTDENGRASFARTWGWRASHCPIDDSALYAAKMEERGLHTQVRVGDATLTLYALSDGYEVIREGLREGYDGFPPCVRCDVRPRQCAHTICAEADPKGLLKGSEMGAVRFTPRVYCAKYSPVDIEPDGSLDKPFWQEAAFSEDFEDIRWNANAAAPWHRTRMKMRWSDTALYIGACLEEDKLIGTVTQRDSVIFRDNDFEVFIDPDNDTHRYYEIEMNILNTVWDLLLTKPYKYGGVPLDSFDIKGLKSAVHVEGSINDPQAEGCNRLWSVELVLPWRSLLECDRQLKAPVVGDFWRINFSRVEWHYDTENGKYVKRIDAQSGREMSEENWIWSPIGVVDMHNPELWGYLAFCPREGGSFEIPRGEYVKWELRRVMYMQREYRHTHGSYALRVSELFGAALPSLQFSMEATPSHVKLYTDAGDGREYTLDSDGLSAIE